MTKPSPQLPTPGPSSLALDGSEASAHHRHDGADAAAEEGVTGVPPSSAAPDSPAGQPDPAHGRSFDAGCANPVEAGRPGLLVADAAVDAFWIAASDHGKAFDHDVLSSDCCVRAGLVAAYPLLKEDLELKWGSGPLVQHVPEDSRPSGETAGEPAAVGAAAGGEVVPASVSRGGQVGTTEPVSEQALRSAEAGPGTRTPGPADSEGGTS